MFGIVFDRVENIVKKKKCWLPAFSPFPRLFSKGIFFRVVKKGLFGKNLMTLRKDACENIVGKGEKR